MRTPSPTSDRGRARGPWTRRAAWLALALLATTVPVLVSWKVFPEGSPNRDDGGYLSQANALRAGELTLPADTHDPFFRPFLSGVEGDEVIFKYQPAWPALIALSDATVGSPRAALAVTGLASTAAVAALALEVTRRRRAAWLAGALFATSPWFFVQSGTYLAYPATVALIAGATALVLRGVRTGSTPLLVAGGAAFGLAVFHRPYDAVLGGLPVLVWLAVASGWGAALARRLAAIAAGAAPFALALLGYNAAVTGNPLTLPFSVVSPLDRFGFGDRSSLADPGEPGPFSFTVAKAWGTLVDFAASMSDWLPGSLLVLAFVALGYRALGAAGRRPLGRLVALQALAFPAGYLVWWGAANARAYRLHYTLGPLYWFPLLAGVAVLAAAGIDRVATTAPGPLRSWSWRAIAAATLAVLTLTSLLTAGDTISDLELARDNRLEEVAALHGPAGTDNVVIAPLKFRGQVSPPVPIPATLDGPDLVALDPTGGLRRFDLIDRFDERTVADVIEVHPTDRPFDRPRFVQRVLDVRSGPTVTLAVTTDQAGPARLTVDGQRSTVDVVDGTVQVDLAADAALGEHVVPDGPPTQVSLRIGDYELEWLVRTSPETGEVEVLDPPTPWHWYHLPGGRPTAVVEDVAAHLQPT